MEWEELDGLNIQDRQAVRAHARYFSRTFFENVNQWLFRNVPKISDTFANKF